MKKFIIVFFIFFLIILTTIIKNSTRKLENQIIEVKQNLDVLKSKYELVLLDYNFLTTPKKLMEYQYKYFENDLVPLDINKIQEIQEKNNKLVITEFKMKNIKNE
jgi:hypothetical protein|tara:strand:- start:104 stop:418 length:315 start_codon:yes stop_codon:yes gene_type:complete